MRGGTLLLLLVAAGLLSVVHGAELVSSVERNYLVNTTAGPRTVAKSALSLQFSEADTTAQTFDLVGRTDTATFTASVRDEIQFKLVGWVPTLVEGYKAEVCASDTTTSLIGATPRNITSIAPGDAAETRRRLASEGRRLQAVPARPARGRHLIATFPDSWYVSVGSPTLARCGADSWTAYFDGAQDWRDDPLMWPAPPTWGTHECPVDDTCFTAAYVAANPNVPWIIPYCHFDGAASKWNQLKTASGWAPAVIPWEPGVGGKANYCYLDPTYQNYYSNNAINTACWWERGGTFTNINAPKDFQTWNCLITTAYGGDPDGYCKMLDPNVIFAAQNAANMKNAINALNVTVTAIQANLADINATLQAQVGVNARVAAWIGSLSNTSALHTQQIAWLIQHAQTTDAHLNLTDAAVTLLQSWNAEQQETLASQKASIAANGDAIVETNAQVDALGGVVGLLMNSTSQQYTALAASIDGVSAQAAGIADALSSAATAAASTSTAAIAAAAASTRNALEAALIREQAAGVAREAALRTSANAALAALRTEVESHVAEIAAEQQATAELCEAYARRVGASVANTTAAQQSALGAWTQEAIANSSRGWREALAGVSGNITAALASTTGILQSEIHDTTVLVANLTSTVAALTKSVRVDIGYLHTHVTALATNVRYLAGIVWDGTHLIDEGRALSGATHALLANMQAQEGGFGAPRPFVSDEGIVPGADGMADTIALDAVVILATAPSIDGTDAACPAALGGECAWLRSSTFTLECPAEFMLHEARTWLTWLDVLRMVTPSSGCAVRVVERGCPSTLGFTRPSWMPPANISKGAIDFAMNTRTALDATVCDGVSGTPITYAPADTLLTDVAAVGAYIEGVCARPTSAAHPWYVRSALRATALPGAYATLWPGTAACVANPAVLEYSSPLNIATSLPFAVYQVWETAFHMLLPDLATQAQKRWGTIIPDADNSRRAFEPPSNTSSGSARICDVGVLLGTSTRMAPVYSYTRRTQIAAAALLPGATSYTELAEVAATVPATSVLPLSGLVVGHPDCALGAVCPLPEFMPRYDASVVEGDTGAFLYDVPATAVSAAATFRARAGKVSALWMPSTSWPTSDATLADALTQNSYTVPMVDRAAWDAVPGNPVGFNAWDTFQSLPAYYRPIANVPQDGGGTATVCTGEGMPATAGAPWCAYLDAYAIERCPRDAADCTTQASTNRAVCELSETVGACAVRFGATWIAACHAEWIRAPRLCATPREWSLLATAEFATGDISLITATRFGCPSAAALTATRIDPATWSLTLHNQWAQDAATWMLQLESPTPACAGVRVAQLGPGQAHTELLRGCAPTTPVGVTLYTYTDGGLTTTARCPGIALSLSFNVTAEAVITGTQAPIVVASQTVYAAHTDAAIGTVGMDLTDLIHDLSAHTDAVTTASVMDAASVRAVINHHTTVAHALYASVADLQRKNEFLMRRLADVTPPPEWDGDWIPPTPPAFPFNFSAIPWASLPAVAVGHTPEVDWAALFANGSLADLGGVPTGFLQSLAARMSAYSTASVTHVPALDDEVVAAWAAYTNVSTAADASVRIASKQIAFMQTVEGAARNANASAWRYYDAIEAKMTAATAAGVTAAAATSHADAIQTRVLASEATTRTYRDEALTSMERMKVSAANVNASLTEVNAALALQAAAIATMNAAWRNATWNPWDAPIVPSGGAARSMSATDIVVLVVACLVGLVVLCVVGSYLAAWRRRYTAAAKREARAARTVAAMSRELGGAELPAGAQRPLLPKRGPTVPARSASGARIGGAGSRASRARGGPTEAV